MSIITVNLEKYRSIVHEKRRIARSEEFKPYDEIIMKQIPGNNFNEAESARQAIRVKYAELQDQIDQAQNIEQLKQISESL